MKQLMVKTLMFSVLLSCCDLLWECLLYHLLKCLYGLHLDSIAVLTTRIGDYIRTEAVRWFYTLLFLYTKRDFLDMIDKKPSGKWSAYTSIKKMLNSGIINILHNLIMESQQHKVFTWWRLRCIEVEGLLSVTPAHNVIDALMHKPTDPCFLISISVHYLLNMLLSFV